MDASTESNATFRLSTDDLQEKDRKAVWLEDIAQTLFRIDYQLLVYIAFRHETLEKAAT